MVWQRAGTVAVVNGSTTVIGTNVDFAASSRNGDAFVGPDGATYELANVASSSVISILPAYKGPSVSGAAYFIVPVQGYDKMLSDAFNNLNNQFGPKLAALGTTGNYDILPASKGGTGNDTGTAPKLSAAAMVGVVSQSSGTPTGALMESGANANGEYFKFACGLMICVKRNYNIIGFSVPANSGPYAFPYAISFPAAFIDPPSSSFHGSVVNSSGSPMGLPIMDNAAAFPSDMNVAWRLLINNTSSISTYAIYSLKLIAIGRWF